MRRITIILFVLISFGCAKENRWDCFKSYGDEITETRSLETFSSVRLETRINVEYYFSEDYRVEVVFGDNIIDHVKTEVEYGQLKISNEAKCNWVRDLSKTPLIRIYAPSFRLLENYCSGDIVFKDTLIGSAFQYEQWEGNGIVDLLLKNDLTEINMHVGYIDVNVRGITSQAELYSSSTGRLRAKNFISPVTLSNNASIQDLELYASDYLYAEINLSGNIKYAGGAQYVESRIIGSGEVLPF